MEENTTSVHTESAFSSEFDLEALRDFRTPVKNSTMELSENARALFGDLDGIKKALGEKETTPKLDTLVNTALIQQAINDGLVPGVAKGTPLKSLLDNEGYRESASSSNKVLTPPSGSDAPVEQETPKDRGSKIVGDDREPAVVVQGDKQPPQTSAEQDRESNESTASDRKSREIMLWDPEDWKVRRKETFSQYYGCFISNDFVDLWGVHRCPALEKRNHPFSKDRPFILYPGKIVYLQSVNSNPEDRYFITVECHFHDKRAKKAMQVLVFVPPQFRPELPEDAHEVDVLGSTFLTLNVNQIDWIRSDNVSPAAVTWGEFTLMRTVLEELSQLPQLPDICSKGADIQPAETKRNVKPTKRRSEPLNKKSPPRSKRSKLQKRKSTSFSASEESALSESFQPSEEDAANEGEPDPEDEELQEINISNVRLPAKPSKEERRKDKKRSGGFKDTSDNKKKGGSRNVQSSALNAQFGSSGGVIPTPASIWAAMQSSAHGVGITEADRAWISTELRRIVGEQVQSSVKGEVEAAVMTALRKISNDQKIVLNDKFRDMDDKLNTLSDTLTQVRNKVDEIGGTPSFTWEQIVAQCKQFQEIQMFSKSQEVPIGSAQYHHGAVGGPPGAYYMAPPAMVQNQPFGNAYAVKSEVPGRSYVLGPSTSAVAGATSDIGGFNTAKLTDMSGMFQQHYPHFRVKSPGAGVPFFQPPPAQVTSATVGHTSPMFVRKSLNEDLSGMVTQQVPSETSGHQPPHGQKGVVTSDAMSSQIAALQKMLPGLTREDLENLVRKNMSS